MPSYAIPSLVDPGKTWTLTLQPGKVEARQFLKDLRRDDVIGQLPSHPNFRFDIGKRFDTELSAEKLALLAHSAGGWWQSGADTRFAPGAGPTTWKLWPYASTTEFFAGVYEPAAGAYWLQLEMRTASAGPHGVDIPPLRGFEGKRFGDIGSPWTGQFCAALARPLGPATDLWYALAQGPRESPAAKDVSVFWPLTAAVNLAARSVRGTSTASLPFPGFAPFLEGIAGQEFWPAWFVALDEPQASKARAFRLRRILPGADAAGKRVRLHLDWSSITRGEKDAATIVIEGEIDASQPSLAGEFGKLLDLEGAALAKVFAEYADAANGKDDLLLSLGLKECKITGGDAELRLGSMIVKPTQGGKSFTVRIDLRGSWTSMGFALSPNTSLEAMPCTFLEAPGSDPRRAVTDVDEAAEESSPIVAYLRKRERTGTFSARSRYLPGRDGRTELTLTETATVVNQKDGSFFWLNLKPFAYGRLSSSAMPGAAQAFTWASDDPEGAQWRTELEFVNVVLPPQAVGEEMDRGQRFDPLDLPDGIVRYRFSRPTYLALAPSPLRENRRWERVPLNFREIARGAHIREMHTEMVYPIEISYRFTEKSTRVFQLTEVAEFYGRPAPVFDPERKDVLPEDLERYHPQAAAAIEALRQRHLRSRNTYVSRLAELHVHDPLRPRGDMQMAEDVTFRIRGKSHGAPPLIDPIPKSALPVDREKLGETGKAEFLLQGNWAKPNKPDRPDEHDNKGALRAGVIHTMEIGSELVEVLRSPLAVQGVVERLAFSALGSTGKMTASFARGKLSFTVEVEHGQLARLVKTRIGRIAALWNRAKHVVVYERSTAVSPQFQQEQDPANNGWPILRKMEEYVEALEPERFFAKERDALSNCTGFMEASVFVSERIYVDGAWARDLGDGYELPLWDLAASVRNAAYYPKPQIHLRCFGEGDRRAKLWSKKPSQLYFYSSTDEGVDGDTDAWRARARVDFDGVPRLPILEDRPKGTMPLADKKAPAADPALCVSPRFDLEVESDGPVNIQHGRSEKPVYATLSRISIARTAQTSPVPKEEIEASGKPDIVAAVKLAAKAGDMRTRARGLAEDFQNLRDGLMKIDFGGNCQTAASAAVAEIDRMAAEMKKKLADNELANLLKLDWKMTVTRFVSTSFDRARIADDLLVQPATAISEQLRAARAQLATDPLLAKQLAQGAATSARDLSVRLVQRVDDVQTRLAKVLDEALTAAEAEVAEARGELANVDGAGLPDPDLKKAHELLITAKSRLETAPTPFQPLAAPLAGVCAFLLEQVEFLEEVQDVLAAIDALATTATDRLFAKALDLVGETAKRAHALLDAAHTYAVGQLKAGTAAFEAETRPLATALDLAIAALLQQVTERAIDALLMQLTTAAQDARGAIRGYLGALAKAEKGILDHVAAIEGALRTAATTVNAAVVGHVSALVDAVAARLKQIVKDFETDCAQLEQRIKAAAGEVGKWIGQQIEHTAATFVTDGASRLFENLKADWEDAGSQGLSLPRFVGGLPKMPPLDFDIDVAAYVTDNVKSFIATTPFVSKLGEVQEAALEALALCTPHDGFDGDAVVEKMKLMGQDVIRKFAGMNFAGPLLRNWDLGERLSTDNVKIHDGFDPKTRRAWVNAKVALEEPKREQLFSIGPIALAMRAASFQAFCGVEIDLARNGATSSRSNAKLTADWILDAGGQPLATFEQVALKYDGVSGFDFHVDPNNIKLHPALKFISDVAALMQPALPPGITIEQENGRPVGVSACTTITVDNPPDLGAVSIGPIDIRSRLGLVIEKGAFALLAAVSVGSRQKPVFVQISFLGGGCWLEARAKYVDGTLVRQISVGLALGSTRSINFASVAQGSYSILLYCYIEIDGAGDRIAMGLSISGSARVIGFVNADIGLLLEATHTGGNIEGKGTLDVSVKISWCYTFRFKRAVKHKF